MKVFKNPLIPALSPKGKTEKQFKRCRRSGGRAACASIVPVCLALGALVAGCGRPGGPALPQTASGFSGADATGVVARVEGNAISVESLQKAVLRRSGGATKETLLEEMIRERALVAKAKAAGYDRDPELVAAFERMIAARFEEEQLAKSTTQISDAEVEDVYRRDLAKYATPAAARAGVIFFAVSSKATAEARAEVKERGEAVLAEAGRLDAAGYARLAQQNSEDQATRYRGGDCGWLNRNEPAFHWDTTVIEAIFSLKKAGEVAPLVATDRGFFIVKLVDTKPVSIKPLEQVKDGIRHQLAQARQAQVRTQMYDEAKRAAKIEVNQAALDSIAEPTMRAAQQPPPMPGG